MQTSSEIQQLKKLKNLNESLLDSNYNLLLRLIKLSRKSGISLDPETMGLVSEVRQKLHLIHQEANPPRGNMHKIHRKGDRTILRNASYISINSKP